MQINIPVPGEAIRLIQAPWYSPKIQEWCDRHGYTDPFFQECQWWAFPPGGVMPIQLEDVMNQFEGEL